MVRRDVLAAPIDDSLVLYDPAAGRAHVLNPSAARIWGRFRTPTSVVTAVNDLVEKTGTETVVVEQDVRAALRRFEAEHLIGPPPELPPDPVSSGGWKRIDPNDVAQGDRAPAATLALLDRTVAVSSPSQEVIDALDWFGAPARTREPPGERYELMLEPAELRTLPSRLNRLAAASTTFVVLHAAAVVFGDTAVVLPAGPGAGKSTLATRLVVDGAGYLTDEVLGIAPESLAVAGYPKRITLELGSWPLVPELDGKSDGAVRDGLDPTRVRWVDARDLNPAALGWRGRALGLGLIVVPQYCEGSPVTVERLPTVDAVVELLSDCFNLSAMGAVGLQTLRAVATGVPCYRLVHGDARVAAETVRALASNHGVVA
jgi:hypothetical protein